MAKFQKKSSRDERTAARPPSEGETTTGAPDRERVARRAYERYLARGGSDGAAMDDWLAAERDLAPDDAEPKPE